MQANPKQSIASSSHRYRRGSRRAGSKRRGRILHRQARSESPMSILPIWPVKGSMAPLPGDFHAPKHQFCPTAGSALCTCDTHSTLVLFALQCHLHVAVDRSIHARVVNPECECVAGSSQCFPPSREISVIVSFVDGPALSEARYVVGRKEMERWGMKGESR